MKINDNTIPIIALCGFLGAGKTTLLNHMLRDQNGRKIAVIVNDFGSINVDSLLITSQTEDTVRLSNGTICCATGDDSIEEVVGRLANQYSMIDLIIIEASGAAEPIHLVQSLSRLRNDYASFDSLLYVIDAHEYENTAKEHPEITEHIEVADCIVLNKTDSVNDEQKEALKQKIRGIASNAFMIESEFGKVDVEHLLGVIEDNRSAGSNSGAVQLSLTPEPHGDHDHDDHYDHAHIHDKLLSTTFRATEPMDPKLLLEFFDNPPPGLYRMKGWIDFGIKGMMNTFIVQQVSGRWRMHIHKSHNRLEHTELLLIGSNELTEKELHDALSACIDKNPGDVSAENMIDVMKYDKPY